MARQRKAETERLNEQLRRINMQLRQQARAGTMYAPGLSYAPVPRSSVATAAAASPDATAAEAGAATATRPPPPSPSLASGDELTSPEQEACREVLREGKRLLRSQQGVLMGALSVHNGSSIVHCVNWQCISPRACEVSCEGNISCML